MSRSRRVAAVVLAAATVAACAWLLSARSPSMVVLDVPASETSAALAALGRSGLSAELRQGQLVVPSDQLSRARATLRDQSAGVAASFEKLAANTDIWSTQEQQDKRWQAAKMMALGRLIEAFDNVRSASVLLEAGKPGSLNRPSNPSASVHVVTADQRPLGAELVQAIGELVCGSVSGLDVTDVRIVDGTGQSYRALGREATARQEQIQQERLLQERWSRRIQASLPGGAVSFVSVRLSEGSSPRPTAVRLAVEREGASEESLAVLRRFAADTAGLDERAVSCETVTAAVASSENVPEPAREAWFSQPIVWAGPLAGFVLGWTVTVLVRRGTATTRSTGILPASRMGVSPMQTPSDEQTLISPTSVPQTSISPLDASDAPPPRTEHGRDAHATGDAYRRLAVLGHLGEAELIGLLVDEHPRTVAIVLAHLPPEKAAGVLAHLPPEQQAPIVRRVANLDWPDEDILRQVERGLTQRLADSVVPASVIANAPGGPDAVAAMLRRMDSTASQAILRALDTDEPRVAEAVRGRLLEFAELDGVDRGTLSEALAGMETRAIALALCAAPESVSRRVLGSLESSRVRSVRAAMSALGPMRLGDVEAAQESLVEAVRCGVVQAYKSSRSMEPALVEREQAWRE